MPKITILENEEKSFASFDAAENTVAIPILYALHTDESGEKFDEELPTPTLFKSVRDLKAQFSAGAGRTGKDFDEQYRRYFFVGDPSIERDYADEIIDKSYAMAYELLLNGLNVLVLPFCLDAEEQERCRQPENISPKSPRVPDYGYMISEEDYVKELNAAVTSGLFETIGDRNLFNIKFITTGAYENVFLGDENMMVDEMADIAGKVRKDCVALITLDKEATDYDSIATVSGKLSSDAEEYKYAACFYPFCRMNLNCGPHKVTQRSMPGCFAYLMAYGNSVKTNANWFAAAGVSRGEVPGLVKPMVEVGENMMHWLQNDGESNNTVAPLGTININPIFNAGVYGYRIWGNRVAWSRPSVLNTMYQEYLNVRILMCDIKKQIFHAAMRTTFEPNDDIVWYSFKSLSSTLLDRMKSGRGIRWYKWAKEPVEEKALIKATLTIQPIEAVESFEVNVILSDQEVEVE